MTQKYRKKSRNKRAKAKVDLLVERQRSRSALRPKVKVIPKRLKDLIIRLLTSKKTRNRSMKRS
jgi:hypothetical protein